MSYRVQVIADSIAHGVRLTTLEVEFPRFILAELNTHRMLSRNSASSRAIPTHKRVEAVLTEPFVPAVWLANQAGMQAAEPLEPWAQEEATKAWLEIRDACVKGAKRLAELNVHKQWANRPLELHGWHTVVITATDWRNFFALRVSEQAQPEFDAIARLMLETMKRSQPVELQYYNCEWHLPYVTAEERAAGDEHTLVKLSTARCARVSYLTHDGVRDPAKDIALHDSLLLNRHMSPFEHPAQCSDAEPAEMYLNDYYGNFRWPWRQYRKSITGEGGAPTPFDIPGVAR
jgi:thymidylate synthase ThyX